MTKTKRSIQWIKQSKYRNIEISREYAGIHLIAEFWGGKVVESEKEIKDILFTAVKKSKNIPLEFISHKFKPQGITAVILLAESHIAIHSWPEKDYMAIDIFSCGKKALPFRALEHLKKKFRPKKVQFFEIKRGTII